MIKVFRERWQRWVNRRVPRSDSQSFNQKNIFILPTGAGVVFGILLLVMLITGINYQNSLIYLTTFLLGALFVGAMHQTHRNLSGLQLTVMQPGEGFAGDEVPYRFRASAGQGPAISIRLSCEDSRVAPFHIAAGQAMDVTLLVTSAHRGYLRPEMIRVETRFPFGLLKAWSWIRPVSPAIIFPRPVVAPDSGSTVEDGDEDSAQRATIGNDNADLRPWREGDLSQRVMWKRYARTGQMVVADWEGEQGNPQWLDFYAFAGADNELRLSYLAWQVLERARGNTPFGLNLPGQVIEPDHGPAHVNRCLRALGVWGEVPPRDSVAAAHGTRWHETVREKEAPV
ncbi:DUF58 domain-containing protein [Marinobacter pelagius]|uniref:DUF58 domain-containing protein n=1 Tax=Marinobacter sp. C7 TaxID=2951363 RepID=UPI001EF028EA|nr:DUF58 domain-containing protein [Marinobacter sp. C7]MCG7199528.1 DUF58 domain-containing protein [Marinobacter sp. C7]